MHPSASEPVTRLLAHYHKRLIEAPQLCAQLGSLGLATPRMIAEFHLGVVDRTAQQALRPPTPRDAAEMRAAWIEAGLLQPNGRERLHNCLVVPLPGTSTAVGVRLRPLVGHLDCMLVTPAGDRSDDLIFTPQRSAHARELVCTLDPIDALMLCRHCVGWVVSYAGTPTARGRARLVEHLLAASPGALQVIAAGTRDGRDLVDAVTAAASLLDRPIRIVHLPAGCSVRDLRRLHGDSAIEALLRDGNPPTRATAVSRTSGRTRSARPIAPWAGLGGSLVGALEAHLVHLETAGMSPEAVRRRMRALDLLRTTCHSQGIVDVDALTVETLEGFQRSLLTGEARGPVLRAPGAPESRNAIIRVLSAARQFLTWALRAGRVARDLLEGLVPLRREATTPPQVLSSEEIESILDATRVRTTTGLRDRAMLEVLYSTGVRRVELVGLDMQDLDESRGVLRVRRGKGGTSRVVPLGRRAQHWVARYVETARIRHVVSAHEPALFLTRRGRRITPKMVTGRMRRCLRAGGISKAGSCHIFRHSMATLMHDAGADIRDLQALLGHALLTSTQLYTRVSMQRLLEVHARTHPAERAPESDIQRAHASDHHDVVPVLRVARRPP